VCVCVCMCVSVCVCLCCVCVCRRAEGDRGRTKRGSSNKQTSKTNTRKNKKKTKTTLYRSTKIKQTSKTNFHHLTNSSTVERDEADVHVGSLFLLKARCRQTDRVGEEPNEALVVSHWNKLNRNRFLATVVHADLLTELDPRKTISGATTKVQSQRGYLQSTQESNNRGIGRGELGGGGVRIIIFFWEH
jgi:hypothetical protein